MAARGFQSLETGRRFNRDEAERLAAVRAVENERWQRARAIGVIGTAFIHFLVLILFRGAHLPPVESPFSAAGPAAGDIRAAAGGGSGMTMVNVRVEEPSPVEEPVPEPVPVIEPVPEVVVEPEEVEAPPITLDPGPVPAPSLPGTGGPGTGGDDGSAAGPGTASGTGAGGGGTGEEGASRIIPPTPRGIFIPPAGRPGSARGQEITVWVFVRENGRVDRETVRLEPPTSDNRYNQRLIQSVAEWVFDPAQQGGRPVPVWYPFQIIL